MVPVCSVLGQNETGNVGSRNDVEFREQAAAVVDCGVG